MKKIIVGLAETDGSRDALWLGKRFAEAEGAQLHVVVVLSSGTSAVSVQEYEQLRQRHFDHVFEIATDELGTGYTPHHLDGISAAAGLTTIAEEIDADAIVIGSSRHGPIGRVLIGDVGSRLSAEAPCSVIVAPRGFARREHASFSRIGVGYDGTPESETALAGAVGMAQEFNGSLVLIGVVPHLLTPGRIGGTDLGYERLLREEMDERLEAASAIDEVEVACTLRVGDTADELADASTDLDLLVLGSRGYGPLRRVLLGGVCAKLMRSSACPVVVLPRGSEKGPERHQVMATLAPFTA